MITLEQRVKRLERLLKVNESEHDTISMYREVDAKANKRTLVKTFTVDNITPKSVMDAIRSDVKNANIRNIDNYLDHGLFTNEYEYACSKVDDEYYTYDAEIADDAIAYFLCVGNDTDNRCTFYTIGALTFDLRGYWEDGDRDEYGYTYGGGLFVDEDSTEISLSIKYIYDHEDQLNGDSPAANKIREMVAKLVKH